MSSTKKNNISATPWLLGAVIVVSGTCVAALDAQVMERPPVVTEWNDSSNVHSVNGINGVNGLNGLNGINGVNGLNGLNGINGVNGLNGLNDINASDGWSKNSWSSAPYNYDPGGQDVWSPLNGVDLWRERLPEPDESHDGDEWSVQPATEWNAPFNAPPVDVPLNIPPPNAPLNAPPMNAPFNAPTNPEWNAPANVPQNAGSDVRAIYPPTWQYPPLVEKVSQGLSSLGVDDEPEVIPPPRPAAPEPSQPPQVLPPPPAPQSQPARSVLIEVANGIIGFFQHLWPF